MCYYKKLIVPNANLPINPKLLIPALPANIEPPTITLDVNKIPVATYSYAYFILANDSYLTFSNSYLSCSISFYDFSNV